MYKRLKTFLEKHHLLFEHQYGFREKHSTEHAIHDIVNQIQNNINQKNYTCGIFIDLQKAFDTVNHSILLDKLSYYGIHGHLNNWFASYLLNRTQTTQIDKHISAKMNVQSGVPQPIRLGNSVVSSLPK